MNVQSINNSNSKAFGAIIPDVNGISKEVYSAIANSRVLKRFGQDFSATATTEYFLGSNDSLCQIGLRLNNIKPLLKTRIKNILQGKNTTNVPQNILLKTKATNEEEFIEAINSRRSDSLHKIYYKG